MAKRKHLINVHTSTGTTAPTGASLYLGELAVQHTTNDPAIWIKMGASESSNSYEKFIGQTEINNLVGGTSGLVNSLSASVVTNKNNITNLSGATTAISQNLNNLSAVTLTGVSLNGTAVTVTDHVAAITGVQTTISDLATIRNNAASGKAAYDGYIAHSANTDIHVTAAQKTAWTNGANSGASAYTDVRNLSAVTITGVSMNGSNVTVTNKVATLGTVITAETKLSSASTGTGNVVTDIAVNDHNITFTKGLKAASDDDIQALSAATTAHTADTTAHITSDERTRWNNAWTSGVSAYTKVEQLSAATTAINNTLTTVSGAAHTKITNLSAGTIALVGASAASVYSSAVSYTNNAISGLNSTTSVTAGNYITGIAIQNGKISGITQTALPSETQLSTASTGTGNVVTNLTVNNHEITMDKGITALTAITPNNTDAYLSATVASNSAITVGTKKAVVADKTALGNVAATGSLVDAKAVKDYVEDQISSAVDYKGSTGSTPSSAEKGDLYVASAGFTIGTGATAKTVEEGDFIIYDGTKWDVIEKNLTGAVTG